MIGQIAGPAAQQSAFEAFVTGVNGAMWVGAALTFAAAMTAFIGLRGVRSPRNEEPVPADAPPSERIPAHSPG